MKKLTLKQHRFVNKYLALGNATEAVMQSYNVKRRVIAAVMAKQLKRKHHIQEAIQLAIENTFIDADSIREKVIKNLLYLSSLKPKRATMNQVIKARDLLLKIKEAYG